MKFVKYTSIGLIIGFGGYACYRLIVKQSPSAHHVKLSVPSNANSAPFLTDPVEKKDSSTTTTPPPAKFTENNSQVEKQLFTSSSSLPLTTPETTSVTEQKTPKTNGLKEHKVIEEEVEVVKDQVIKDTKSDSVEEKDKTNDQPKISSVPENSDLTVNQESTITSENDLSISSKRNGPKEVSLSATASPSTTNCSLDVCPSTPCSSPLDVSEFEGELTTGSIEDSNLRSFSMTSQSSMLGEGMVAKLEQILQDVGKLQESVGEINADLVTVRKSDPKLLTIAGDSISLGDETNGDSMVLNGKDECSQTPSLEWDSNGIHLLSDPDSNQSTIKEEDESLLSESLLSEKSELFSPISSGSLNSTAEPSLFITSLGDITNDQTDKEMSSLQFSTSDANENFV